MIGVAVLFTATPYQHVNAEDGEVVNNPRMTLDSYTTQPGNYAYINLYAYDFVNVMGLEYSIHYDSQVMTLNSYNIGYFVEGSVTNVNDQNVGEIKGSVVNVDGLNGSGQVLGMNFYINQEAQPGTYPITLTIGDAYDMELGTVSIAKESGKLVVNEPSSTVKNISFGCYLNNYNVKYDEKVTYTIQAYDVYQLAAGKFEVEYDSEVLALEDVIIADSLITETAIYTIEDERAGLVQITYADIDPIQDWTQCFTLTFSVIKNENTQTEIKFSADNLLDVNLADLATSTYSNTLNIEEVVYYPTVRIDASNPAEDGTFTADVVFEKGTDIAAGDFTITYNTYEVLCTSVKANSSVSANGGYIYTKEKIDEGSVFFSYVNTKPFTEEQMVLTMTFEPVNKYYGRTTLELKGQDVVNEAYEDITLTYQGANVEVPRQREDIQNLEYYLESYEQYYSGYEIRPYFYFYNGLSEGWDYSLEYSNNINVGIATLTVTGMNNYKGTITLTFEILPRSINDFYLNLQERYLTYDGTAKFPSVQVDNLVEGRDYTVSYSNNLNVGQGTVTVTGIGNYTGTMSDWFQIQQAYIHEIPMSLEQSEFAYTGSPIEPNVIVEGLTRGKDFEVSYYDNTEMGTGTAYVYGIGNYTGEVYLTFNIGKGNFDGKTIILSNTEYTYDGKEKRPNVYVYGLMEGSDFSVSYSDNVNVGTATATITGIGNYDGTKEVTFTIKAADITKKSISLMENEFVYDGTAKEPEVSIAGLNQGIDYELSYKNNVNAGTATVVITGIGNYTGTVEKTFVIEAAAIGTFNAVLSETYYVHDGNEKEPSVTINGLVEGTDFEVSYVNNDVAGTATVVITGLGNYKGTKDVSFSIVAVSEIILDQEKVVLNEGETKQIKVTVVLEDGNTIQDVTWVSLNDGIVSVDNGTITAVSGGITKVQVKAGTKVAELEVTVYCASHTAGEWVVAKEPTVKETGLKVQYCSVCGAVVNEEEIPMLECSHSYSNYISDGNATCMEDGTKTATCDICERETHTIPDEGSKLSHRFVEYVSNKDATYNKNGTETAICANEGCDEEHTREEADSMLKDSVAPSATITIGENSWNVLVKPLIYDLFTTAAFDVTVDAVDNESGVESVEYYVAPAELADVTKVTNWTTYKAFSIDKEGTYVVYVKVTDKQGNVTYISSNGLVIDRNAPVLEGISDSGSYCDGAIVTVNDMFLGSVLINGEEVELFNDGFTLTGTEDGTEYAIEAYDRAGNKTSMTVTVFAGHVFEDYQYNGDKTETAECSRGCGATDTRKIRTGWNLVDGEWCYFDQTGKMVCNKWIADSKGWCYVGEDGRMLYNQWVKDSKGYCFVDASGYMVYNKWVHDGNGWAYAGADGYRQTSKWIKDSVGWCYVGTDGYMVCNDWVADSKDYVYLGESGYMVTNKWIETENGWCYVGSDGYKTTNKWIKKDGNWCYVGADGYLVKNQWVKYSTGWCYLNDEGLMLYNQWVKDSKGWCYVDSSGYMVYNKWVKDDIGWAYAGADGYRVMNKWVKDSIGWCYVDEDGYMLYNQWIADSKGWCFVDGSGYMVYNKWVHDGIGWAYAGKDGYRVMNKWVKDSTGWCYVDENGYMIYNQWVKDSTGYCYVDESGYMVYNQWVEIDGNKYYVNSSGYRVENAWMQLDGKYYYFKEDGSMAKNETIGDYYVDEDGVWIP